MKKRSILIGLSLATGVVSSLLLRKEKQKNENRQNFIGNFFSVSFIHIAVCITISVIFIAQ